MPLPFLMSFCFALILSQPWSLLLPLPPRLSSEGKHLSLLYLKQAYRGREVGLIIFTVPIVFKTVYPGLRTGYPK